MFGSGRESLPEVREALLDVSVGWEALLDVRQWSRGPPEISRETHGCLGVVGSFSQMSAVVGRLS